MYVGDTKALTWRPTQDSNRLETVANELIQLSQCQLCDVANRCTRSWMIECKRVDRFRIVVNSSERMKSCLTETLIQSARAAKEAEQPHLPLFFGCNL